MQITGHTRLGGLLGSPVAHSLSPHMYNETFQTLGLDYTYLCFDVQPEQAARVVQAFRDFNAFGFNCTMPMKQAVMPYLDELSTGAKLIGAVNTVKNENGKLTGYNTDGAGFMRSVRDADVDVRGREVILLGAGGAASSIAVQAALDGVSYLHFVCRRSKSWPHAVSLAERISAQTACQADVTDSADLPAVQALIDRAALLINGTSVGMSPNEEACPLPDTIHFPQKLAVGDVIYHPRETLLLQRAKAQGCCVFNGMYMLLYQGAEAFHIWTGLDMPVEQIRAHYFS